MQKNHYDTLEVPRTASADDIKRAYRRMSSQLHPDKNPGKDTTAAMQGINSAYSVLSDPHKKFEYDRELPVVTKFRDFEFRMEEMERLMKQWEELTERAAKMHQTPMQQPPRPSPSADVPKPRPKRAKSAKAPKAKPGKAAETTAEQQHANLEALRAEVRRMCSIPPAPLSEAGVMATREWKKAAAKWHPFVSHPAVSIEILNAARRAMIEAAAAVPAH